MCNSTWIRAVSTITSNLSSGRVTGLTESQPRVWSGFGTISLIGWVSSSTSRTIKSVTTLTAHNSVTGTPVGSSISLITHWTVTRPPGIRRVTRPPVCGKARVARSGRLASGNFTKKPIRSRISSRRKALVSATQSRCTCRWFPRSSRSCTVVSKRAQSQSRFSPDSEPRRQRHGWKTPAPPCCSLPMGSIGAAAKSS